MPSKSGNKATGNRSVRETKRRLSLALIALLVDRPLREITVRELTQRAGLSRGTFYFHYSDIFDLVSQLENEELERLNEVMDAVLPRLDREAPPEALVALYRYLAENAEGCSALLGPNGDPDFVVRVQELMANRGIGHKVQAGAVTPQQRYLTEFCVTGSFGVVRAWLDGGCVQPPEEMAAVTWQAIHAAERSGR